MIAQWPGRRRLRRWLAGLWQLCGRQPRARDGRCTEAEGVAVVHRRAVSVGEERVLGVVGTPELGVGDGVFA